MHRNSKIHNRQSKRLKGYDYSQQGFYFITMVCENRRKLFGKIENGKMILNKAGEIAKACWLEIPSHFPKVVLHEFIIMPNHVHGIIEIKENKKENSVGAKNLSPRRENLDIKENNKEEKDLSEEEEFLIFLNQIRLYELEERKIPKGTSKTIGSIVRGFKIGVTKWMRKNSSIQKVWQRDYHDRIIRSDREFYFVTEYIKNNPANSRGE